MGPMKKLGIIGGMGPAATARLFGRIVEFTTVGTDQEYIDVTILSDPAVPDRTGYLLGRAGAVDFVPVLQRKAAALRDLGCEVVAVPCNTSHARLDAIASAAPELTFVPMPDETARFAAAVGCTRPLILATDGTLACDIFQTAAERAGIQCAVPTAKVQPQVMAVIYDYVKAGRPAPEGLVQGLIAHAVEQGADGVILGCTELSTLGLPARCDGLPVIDALDVLAWRSVIACEAPAHDLLADFA